MEQLAHLLLNVTSAGQRCVEALDAYLSNPAPDLSERLAVHIRAARFDPHMKADLSTAEAAKYCKLPSCAVMYAWARRLNVQGRRHHKWSRYYLDLALYRETQQHCAQWKPR